ncbi:hypothetical protein LMG27174_06623 [Paraburkholderia rhynchosiae]|nr:hypothetical protein LMG27174_06623 [Paraburkholderia rhynchosiae]
MKLRRDVYIPAVEAVYAAMSSLGALADPGNSRSGIQEKFVEAVGAISKVNAVAGLETVAAVGTLLQRLLAVNLELSVKRNAIEVTYGQFRANADTVTRAVAEHGRWVQVQTSMLFEGPPVPEKWNFVANQIAFHQGQIDLWTVKQAACSRELQVAQLAFLRAIAESQPKLTEASVSASIALRDELGMLDGSPDLLRRTLAENGELARRALEESIARMEREIGRCSMVSDEKPVLVEADGYRRLVEADAYDAQAPIEWAVTQVEQLRSRIVDGQSVVIMGSGAPLSIWSAETFDEWVLSALPNTWAVMQADAKRFKAT